jgi:hypothetical protein
MFQPNPSLRSQRRYKKRSTHKNLQKQEHDQEAVCFTPSFPPQPGTRSQQFQARL